MPLLTLLRSGARLPGHGTPSRKENGAAPAKDGPGKLGSNCQTVPAYAELIVEVTVLKVALICEPSPRAAAMMPTAIRAAIDHTRWPSHPTCPSRNA